MVEESRADQAFSAHPAAKKCAMHKDASLTLAESWAPPLDPLSALFLDVDGTLLEIDPRPELVRVTNGLPALLIWLSADREGALDLFCCIPLCQLCTVTYTSTRAITC